MTPNHETHYQSHTNLFHNKIIINGVAARFKVEYLRLKGITPSLNNITYIFYNT